MPDEEYLKMVDAKLDEELAEYHKDQNIEELADLLEVIYAAAIARGYSIEGLERVRAEKAGYLYSQYHFYDIYQNSRYADFVLENGPRRIAIEIDDEASHNKQLVSSG